MVRKVSLIEDWKRSWKFASMRWNALGVLIMTLAEILGQAWQHLPDNIRSSIPHASTLGLAIFLLSMLGRILKKDEGTQNNGSE